jgi:hypothetical protein
MAPGAVASPIALHASGPSGTGVLSIRPVKETIRMHFTSPVSSTIVIGAVGATEPGLGAAPVRRLTAHDDGLLAGGLFTEPVDVSLLEELQVDELGRRSRWLPGDVLL